MIAFQNCSADTDTCKFCSGKSKELTTSCVPGTDYSGLASGDVVELDGWKLNPFRRVSFESKTMINQDPYQVSFTAEKLWPYLNHVYTRGAGKQVVGGLSEPVQMLCVGGQCDQTDDSPDSSDKPIMTTPKPDQNTKKKPKTGIIIGSTIGGLIALAVIGWLIWFLVKKRKNSAVDTINNETNVQAIGTPTTPRSDIVI